MENELFRIKGVAKGYAGLLVAAGIQTAEDLSRWEPAGLHAVLAATNRSEKLVRRLPEESQVADWVQQAVDLTYPLAKFARFAIETGIPDLAEGYERRIARTLMVTYDGEVLRPQAPLDLEPNRSYQVTIEEVVEQPHAHQMPEVFRRTLDRARALGVGDLAEQHDHYLYGTPKR